MSHPWVCQALERYASVDPSQSHQVGTELGAAVRRGYNQLPTYQYQSRTYALQITTLVPCKGKSNILVSLKQMLYEFCFTYFLPRCPKQTSWEVNRKNFFLLTPHAKIHSVQLLDVHPVDSNVKRDYDTHCYGCIQHSAGQIYQKSLWSAYMFLHMCEILGSLQRVF